MEGKGQKGGSRKHLGHMHWTMVVGVPLEWKMNAKCVGIYLSLKFHCDLHLKVSYRLKEMCSSGETVTEELYLAVFSMGMTVGTM